MIQTTDPWCATFVPMRQLAVVTFVVCALMSMVHGRAPELVWPQFRGPQGAGVLPEGKLPTTLVDAVHLETRRP